MRKVLGVELYFGGSISPSAIRYNILPLRVRRQPQAKAGAGAAGRHAGAVPPLSFCACRELVG
jgi:hypothetical protein